MEKVSPGMSAEDVQRLREKNRQRDPLLASMMDRVREVFPDAQLVKVHGGNEHAMTPWERKRMKAKAKQKASRARR